MGCESMLGMTKQAAGAKMNRRQFQCDFAFDGTFSSDTVLGIGTASPVRRNPNKEKPYELLIAVPLPSAPQHPFKIRIPFKSHRFCRPLCCDCLSAAHLQENNGNGLRNENQLEAALCLLPSLFPHIVLPYDPFNSSLLVKVKPSLKQCHRNIWLIILI